MTVQPGDKQRDASGCSALVVGPEHNSVVLHIRKKIDFKFHGPFQRKNNKRLLKRVRGD
jgi:hypothetical protein